MLHFADVMIILRIIKSSIDGMSLQEDLITLSNWCKMTYF